MSEVDILSDHRYRVLGSIAACNQSQYTPAPRRVTLWQEAPQPAEAVNRTLTREINPLVVSLDGNGSHFLRDVR